MGLLGGFKAKFTRKVKEKPQTGVVCLNYRVFSEFDPQPQYNTSAIHLPGTSSTDQPPELPKSSPPRFVETPEYINLTPTEEVQSPKVINPPKSILKSKSAFDEHQPSSSQVLPNHSKTDEEILQYTYINENTIDTEDNKSTLIYMTENREDQESDDCCEDPTIEQNYFPPNEEGPIRFETNESNGYPQYLSTHEDRENQTHFSDQNYELSNTVTDNQFYFNSNEEEADQYEINNVQYDINDMTSMKSYDLSEDDTTSVDNTFEFTAMGYSSQAASIFFGGDENNDPIPLRRRNFRTIEDDNISENSSASA